MIAGVHDNPLGAEPAVNIDITSEILVDGFGHKGRIFRDIDGREGMQAEMDIMLLAGLVDIRGACIVEAGEGVVGGVELNVDVADVGSGRPMRRPPRAGDGARHRPRSCPAMSFPTSPVDSAPLSLNNQLT